MRLQDLRTAIEVVTEANSLPRGARRRIAKRSGMPPSVITDRISRVEGEAGVKLFDGPNRATLTSSGQALVRWGPQFLEEYRHFLEVLQAGR